MEGTSLTDLFILVTDLARGGRLVDSDVKLDGLNTILNLPDGRKLARKLTDDKFVWRVVSLDGSAEAAPTPNTLDAALKQLEGILNGIDHGVWVQYVVKNATWLAPNRTFRFFCTPKAAFLFDALVKAYSEAKGSISPLVPLYRPHLQIGDVLALHHPDIGYIELEVVFNAGPTWFRVKEANWVPVEDRV